MTIIAIIPIFDIGNNRCLKYEYRPTHHKVNLWNRRSTWIEFSKSCVMSKDQLGYINIQNDFHEFWDRIRENPSQEPHWRSGIKTDFYKFFSSFSNVFTILCYSYAYMQVCTYTVFIVKPLFQTMSQETYQKIRAQVPYQSSSLQTQPCMSTQLPCFPPLPFHVWLHPSLTLQIMANLF